MRHDRLLTWSELLLLGGIELLPELVLLELVGSAIQIVIHCIALAGARLETCRLACLALGRLRAGSGCYIGLHHACGQLPCRLLVYLESLRLSVVLRCEV